MKKSRFLTAFIGLGLALISADGFAQSTLQQINDYGTFDHWCTRRVKESSIIGGAEKYLHEFYGNQECIMEDGHPYVAPEGYIWRTNNVVAKIMGIIKTNATVFPEERGDGYCARIETHMETVKAMGIIDLDVCCQGAMVVGVLPEYIRDTKNPMAKVFYGVPFQGRPEKVVFDYKADVGHHKVIATGLSRVRQTDEPDYPIAVVILQKRWEDSEGHIHAKRVGTAIHLFKENHEEWVNGFEMPIHYGDISSEPFYEPYMGLNNDKETAFHAENSKGRNCMVHEEAWALPNEEPNHIVINFLSSSGGAFAGGVGNTLWIDNFKVVMPERRKPKMAAPMELAQMLERR